MDNLLDWGRRVLAEQPFSRLVGAELASFTQGQAELRIPIRDDLRQQFGFVHGGVVSYAADNALTYAGGSVLGPNVVTAEYKINYVRPALGEVLIARATVLHSGRTQAVCRCDVFAVRNGAESLCATAQGTITKRGEPG
jgi:uncharacterized protein (TIGR00369 family)